MRVQASVVSLSWIPTDSLRGPLKTGMDLRLSHWDAPLPERVQLPHEIDELRRHDKFRFANVLSAWADVEGGEIVSSGVDRGSSGVQMGSTMIRVGKIGATFRAVGLPVLTSEPVHADGSVRFVQTAGGRTGVPLPRPVPHPPYVRWQAPIVWTTLALTLRPDGSSEVDLAGASSFPRHWVYDAEGKVVLKSGLADQSGWMAHSFGIRTPWADHDREALVVGVESDLERELSSAIMRGGERPEIRNLPEGAELTRQGSPGDELYLVLDGITRVDVDGKALAELGPGAVIGERALLEGGVRTSTVVAVTPVRVAVAARGGIDLDRLRTLAASHHREDLVDAEGEVAEAAEQPIDLD